MRKLNGKSWALGAATAAVVALLAACGGGGGGGSGDSGGGGFVAGTDVPTGVQQNIGDVIAFAKQLIAGTSDSSDPVVLGDATLATDDAAEPADL
jgi:hypothetical protein